MKTAEQGSRTALGAVGEACLLGSAVVLFASIPTALRASAAGGSFLGGWIVGAALLLPAVAIAVLLGRSAGRGFRVIAGTRAPRLGLLGILLWVGLAAPLLALLGAGLKAATHHTGLGGATFGVLGLVVVATTALIADRLVRLGELLIAHGLPPWVVAAVGGAIGTLPVVVLAMPIPHAATDVTAARVHAAMLDGGIVLVAAALAATWRVSPKLGGVARLAGVPLALLLCLGGLGWLRGSPAVGDATLRGGGLAATVLGAARSLGEPAERHDPEVTGPAKS